MPWLSTTCPAMPHHTTTLLLYILLMLMLGASAQSSNAKLEAPSSVSSRERCLVDEPVPERKFLTHNSDKQVITLLGSQRIASRYLLLSLEDGFLMMILEVRGNSSITQITCFHLLKLLLSPFHHFIVHFHFEYFTFTFDPTNISLPGYSLQSSPFLPTR